MISYNRILLIARNMLQAFKTWKLNKLRFYQNTQRSLLLMELQRNWLNHFKVSNPNLKLNLRLWMETKVKIRVQSRLWPQPRTKILKLLQIKNLRFLSWPPTKEMINPMKKPTKRLKLILKIPSSFFRVNKELTKKRLELILVKSLPKELQLVA